LAAARSAAEVVDKLAGRSGKDYHPWGRLQAPAHRIRGAGVPATLLRGSAQSGP